MPFKKIVQESAANEIAQTSAQAKQLDHTASFTLTGDATGSVNSNLASGNNVSIAVALASGVVTADELDVVGNGTIGDLLVSDGDGSFSWSSPSALGSVSSVAAGNGMDFTEITGSGSVILGTPSSVSAASANSVTATSHTHDVVSSANPGVSASLLQTDASGLLTLAELIVTGDLTVQGSMVSVATTNLEVSDSVVLLNSLADGTNYAAAESALIFGHSTQASGGKIINQADRFVFTSLNAADLSSGSDLPAGGVLEGAIKDIEVGKVKLYDYAGSLPGSAEDGMLALSNGDLYIWVS